MEYVKEWPVSGDQYSVANEDTACLGLYSFAEIKTDINRQVNNKRSFIIQNALAFSFIVNS